MANSFKINPVLLKLATQSLTKQALVPAQMGGDPAAAGGAPPADPAAAGGAPPADPNAAAAAPAAPAVDPAIQAQVQQAAQAAGVGPAAGKAGGKKLEQQVLDTKLWQILYVQTLMAQQMGVKLPPQVLVGPPPDPGAQAIAQQDNQTMQSAVGAPAPADAVSAGASPDAAAMGGADMAPKAAFAQPSQVFDGSVDDEAEPMSLARKARARTLIASALRGAGR